MRALVSESILRSDLRMALEKDLKKPMPDEFCDGDMIVVVMRQCGPVYDIKFER